MQENKKNLNKRNLQSNKKHDNQKKNSSKKQSNNLKKINKFDKQELSKHKSINKTNSKNNQNSKTNTNSKKKHNANSKNNSIKQINVSKNKKIINDFKDDNNICLEYYPIKKKKIEEVDENRIKIQEKGNFEQELRNSKKSKKKNKKYLVVIFGIIILIIFLIGAYQDYSKKMDNLEVENRLKLETEQYEKHLEIIKNSYNEYVLTKENINLYNKNLEIVGLVSNVELVLDDFTNPESEYFKLKNYNLYVKYDSIVKIDSLKEENKRYQNYLPFNLSIITNKDTKLYVSSDSYYILNEARILPVIINETDRYYVSFDNKLVYVLKSEATIEESLNSNLEIASTLSVLNYHFVINKNEKSLCTPNVICHDENQFDAQMKYLKDNDFYTITMKELEMFIDSKINLPKKTVSITIDDGWFVARAIPILEKYDLMGTLFLIGSLAPSSDYQSDNLEIHSHTWDLHDVSNCKDGRSPLLCYSKEKIVKDLLKSRESLNNTTYFCYPFYEYNNHAISALKEAGFTMALTGGNVKVKKGINKYKVPRYVIYDTTTLEKFKQIIN